MKVQHIIGADLSKKTIDVVCQTKGDHLVIVNSQQGFKDFIKWLKQLHIQVSEIMVVMEHTGLYSLQFEEFLNKQSILFSKVNALQIKRSMGMVRGKSDKLDAARIACYGYEKKEKITAEPPASSALQRLQLLHSTRDRLVRHRAALSCAVKEYRHIELAEKDVLIQSQVKLIKNFDEQIEKLEEEMKKIIDQASDLKRNYQLLQSIKGVGKVVALATIIKTRNFSRFSSSRKFACFCGTAPFEHSSGSSIRKKSRVSHLADKQMKSLLDLAAKAAIQYDKELKSFYKRRLEMGKSKMSTINIVRNKLLYRMFAVIKRQTPYQENYLQVA